MTGSKSSGYQQYLSGTKACFSTIDTKSRGLRNVIASFLILDENRTHLTKQTDSLIKIEAAEKLDDRDDKNVYGVKGFKANIVLVKSRLAPAGRNIVGIFSQDLGFDEILCGFELLKQFGGITGTGSYALAHHPEVKFRLRELKTKYAENAEFRKAFDDEVEQTGDALVKVMTREELNNLENTNHNDLKEAELEDTAVETKEEEAK